MAMAGTWPVAADGHVDGRAHVVCHGWAGRVFCKGKQNSERNFCTETKKQNRKNDARRRTGGTTHAGRHPVRQRGRRGPRLPGHADVPGGRRWAGGGLFAAAVCGQDAGAAAAAAVHHRPARGRPPCPPLRRHDRGPGARPGGRGVGGRRCVCGSAERAHFCRGFAARCFEKTKTSSRPPSKPQQPPTRRPPGRRPTGRPWLPRWRRMPPACASTCGRTWRG